MSQASKKVKDTGADISYLSRLDKYWRAEGFSDKYTAFRKPSLKLQFNTPEDAYNYLITDLDINGIEFGNWVGNESRYTYLFASIIALKDIYAILRLPPKKKARLGLAFGARGMSRAVAHFEPARWIINLTRFERGGQILSGGGPGSLAHEYGHYLDYYYGTYYGKGQRRSLTLGSLVNTTPAIPTDKPGALAFDVVLSMIWKNPATQEEHTGYYKALLERFYGREYWFRHNELFARGFEQYIQHKLKRRKVSNVFLTHSKYQHTVYMDDALAKIIFPKFDKLIAALRKLK